MNGSGISTLTPDQQALLMMRLRKKAAERTGPESQKTSLGTVTREENPRLSFAQQRLWFVDQLDPGSPKYNLPVALRLTGTLDVDALTRSIHEIERRHEALRTVFPIRNGQPVQFVSPDSIVRVVTVDLSGLPAAEREAEARRLAREEALQAFDLAAGPLMRATLLRLGETEHVALLTMHHAISDGWSMSILVREIAVLYEAFVKGLPSPLPPLTIQYADFAAWQRERLSGAVMEEHLAYWRGMLGTAPSVLELPSDRPRPPVQTSHGAEQGFELSPNFADALKALARREELTPFMILFAAYTTLLARYTGQEDMVVASPIAGRTEFETEGIIGFFVNTVALRMDLTGDPSFRALLSRARKTTLDAFVHQEMPFETLVETLQLERDLSRNPLCQVAFALQNAPMPPPTLTGLTLSPMGIANETAKFELQMDIWESGEGLAGTFIFNTDLFDRATIARLARHFQSLVTGLVAHPERRISGAPLMDDAELHQVVVDWNATRTAYPSDKCIHELFEEQVLRAPGAAAVLYDGSPLTYRELNERANQLAHVLRKRGVGPDVQVGICVERSTDLIVGLLGILKAGGAYLPLDPSHPPERLAFMLADAGADVLLTQEALAGLVPGFDGARLCLDSEWETVVARASVENTPRSASSGNLAYVNYTSGSTGTPKGIGITHRSVNRLVFNSNYIALGPSDRVAQAANTSFDAATFEIWGALLQGAQVTGIGRDVLLSIPEFARKIQELGITAMFLTTAFFNQLAREAPESLRSLKHLLFGGEAVDPQWVRAALIDGSPERLLHVYGPTECTTFATWHPVRDVPEGAVTVPIGKPLSNTETYVLDRAMNPTPIGVPGELYLGGAGLAREYLKRPELTAEKFVPHRFSGEPGARLYRTGDLVRSLPDGALEFLGRIDQQVKIRGFRIELGEIETALARHASVKEAVVLAREDAPGSKRLVAYVVQNETGGDAAPATIGEYRTFLGAYLPAYMAPSIFVFLDSLPLTPNGKVDKRALPAPDRARAGFELGYAPPRTPAEQALADIWARVLEIDQVGIDDNFFELGGDSLLSIQIVAQANQAGLALTPKLLFQHQTVGELAAAVEAAIGDSDSPASEQTGFAEWDAPAIQPEQGLILGPVRMTPGQYWFFDEWKPANPHCWNMCAMFELLMPLDPDLLVRALREVMTHHDAVRARFTFNGARWDQHYAAPDEVQSLVRFDFPDLPDSGVAAAIDSAVADLTARMDVTSGPLLVVAYFNLGAARPARLLFIQHHLIGDGYSVPVMLDDLMTACRKLLGEDVHLPVKTTSVRQWTDRLHEFARSAAGRRDVEYWRSRPWEKVAPLPVDFAEALGPQTPLAAGFAGMQLSAEETRELQEEIPRVLKCRVSDVLLTAYLQAAAQWNGAGAQLVDVISNGRVTRFADIDLSRTVGWLAGNTYSVFEIDPAMPFEKALRSLEEQMARIPTTHIDYEVLRYLLEDAEIVAELKAHMLPDLEFNYIGKQGEADVGDLPIRLVPEHTKAVMDPNNRRRSPLLFCRGHIEDDRLRMDVQYSKDLHRHETIENLVRNMEDRLRAFIAICRSISAIPQQ